MSDSIPILTRREDTQNLGTEIEKHLFDISDSLGRVKERFIQQQERTGIIVKNVLGNITDNLFKKREKKYEIVPPNEGQLKKMGVEGASAVYLGEKLDEIIKEDKKEERRKDGKGLFTGLGLGATGIGAVAARLFPSLMKVLPLAAIAGGIIWMVVDGIKASIKAEEWGVSKISAILGGVLGGTGKGLENAFKNAGKFALLGAGIGTLIAPGLGTIAGGILGAAIGGILGFIGGEKIAQSIEKIKEIGGNVWEKAKEILPTLIDNIFGGLIDRIKEKIGSIKEIWKGDDSIGSKIGETIGHIVTFVPGVIWKWILEDIWPPIWEKINEYKDELLGIIISPFTGAWEAILGWRERFGKIWKDEDKTIWTKIKESALNYISFIPQILGGFFGGLFTSVRNFFKKVFGKEEDIMSEKEQRETSKETGSMIFDLFKIITGFLGDIFKGFLSGIRSGLGLDKGWFQEKIINPIVQTIGNLISKAIEIKEKAEKWIKDHITGPIGNFFGGIGKRISILIHGGTIEGEEYEGVVNWVKTRFADPIVKFFNNLKDKVDEYKTKISDWVTTYIINPVKNFFNIIGEFLAKAQLTGAKFAHPLQFGKIGRNIEQLLGLGLTHSQILKLTSAIEGDIPTSLKQIVSELQRWYGVEAKRSYLQRKYGIEVKETENAQDVIITPEGKLIRTHPDDTLIATKNPVVNVDSEFDKEISSDIRKLERETSSTIIEQNNKIIDLLSTIAERTIGEQNNNVLIDSRGGVGSEFDPFSSMQIFKKGLAYGV